MKVNVLGVNIDALTKEELIHKLRNQLTLPEPVFIVTPYSEMIVAAQKDKKFREILNTADFALPDGIGVLWSAYFLSASKLYRHSIFHIPYSIWLLLKTLLSILIAPDKIRSVIPEQISGAEFVWNLSQIAEQFNYSIFLLGGYGDTPDKTAKKLQEKFPNLKIAGIASPVIARTPHLMRGTKQSRDQEIASPPAADRNDEIVNQINSSGADFLLVALGPIRQEKWIHENLPNLRVKLAIGLGGTFDYVAGKRPYRPKFWAGRGLEWLWRLITQPRRIWRICRGVVGLIYYSFRAKMRGY